MEASTTGFSPEQIATGTLEDGKEIIVLYVKEYSEQLNRVRLSGQIGYFYTWTHMAETDSFVLFIYWDNDEEVAIVFPPKQHYIVESMRAPQQLIITALPINSLIEVAQQAGLDFIDLEGPVVCLADVVFKKVNDISNLQ